MIVRQTCTWRGLGLMALALTLGLGVGIPAARADHIDDKLIEAAPEIVKMLQGKGFKNVGVLKFLVKKGNAKTDGSVGPMNMNMADRVENALILGMEEAKPLNVIHQATDVAAKADPKFSVKSAEARARLFSHKYPLAWGTEKVTPDAFITGTVDLSPDMKKTTVELGFFDKSGKLSDLTKLEMKTDRSILADSGQSFAISSRSLKKSRTLAELDDDAANSASQADTGTPVNQQLTNNSDSAPIKFEIQYSGTPKEIKPDPNSAGEMTVDTPNKGDMVRFMLTNTTSGKIGVVIKVNGVSTIENETAEDAGCMKWVLEPGKTYGIEGFYSQDKLDRFKVLDDEESAARMADWAGSRPRAGYIDVTVFKENDGPGEEMKVGRTLRSLTSNGKKQGHPSTISEARSLVKSHASGASSSSKRKSRGLIVEGGGTEGKTLEKDELKNPSQVYQMQISYYKPTTQAAPGQ